MQRMHVGSLPTSPLGSLRSNRVAPLFAAAHLFSYGGVICDRRGLRDGTFLERRMGRRGGYTHRGTFNDLLVRPKGHIAL